MSHKCSCCLINVFTLKNHKRNGSIYSDTCVDIFVHIKRSPLLYTLPISRQNNFIYILN